MRRKRIRPLHHPDIANVTVAGILHALSDPARLALVRALMKIKGGANCVETAGLAGLSLPRSTCSQHYQILREAGLIHSERRGVELTSRVRYEELQERFPGLLDGILDAFERENGGG